MWSHVSEVSHENHYGYALFASVDLEPADVCTSGQRDTGEDCYPGLQGSSPELGCLPVQLEVKLQVCCSLCWFFSFSLTLKSQDYKLAELHFLTQRAILKSGLSAGV